VYCRLQVTWNVYEVELFIKGRTIERPPVLFRTMKKSRGSTSTQATITVNLEV
jgi:hypothetical protein